MAKPGTGQQAGFALQARDIEILRGLFESRIATLAQLAELHFDGRKEAAKKRVQKLKAAGLVSERPRRPEEPAIHRLSNRAFELLTRRNELSDYPSMAPVQFERRMGVSQLTLRHEMDVMDVKAAVIRALRPVQKVSVRTFSTWPRLSEFRARHPITRAQLTLKPDAFLEVQERQSLGALVRRHRFFLEVDRSTESLQVFVARLQCYRDASRRGTSINLLSSFRVLVVCKTGERRNSIARQLLALRPPIRTLVWLSTQNEVISNPLGAIWVTPSAYQAADGKVESGIWKLPLFDQSASSSS